jgi:hypothetical protein
MKRLLLVGIMVLSGIGAAASSFTDQKILEKKIDYFFKEKNLLKIALTHKTHAFEAKIPMEYNERLEFLGDVFDEGFEDESSVAILGWFLHSCPVR